MLNLDYLQQKYALSFLDKVKLNLTVHSMTETVWIQLTDIGIRQRIKNTYFWLSSTLGARTFAIFLILANCFSLIVDICLDKSEFVDIELKL